MTLGTTIQGAARLRGRDNNPDVLLRHLVETAKDPFNREAVLGDFIDTVLPPEFRDLLDFNQRDMLVNLVTAWASNAYMSAIRNMPKPGQTFEDVAKVKRQQQVVRQTEQAKAASKKLAKVVKVIEVKAKALLLVMVMPNGKTLGDCTGAELREFNGWTSKLADMVPAHLQVGDVLSEAEVRKFAPKEWD